MHLHLLRKTACLTIYYDSGNDWLFLDWEGEVTLPNMQEACLELAQCYLARPYSRVLNSNVQVTNVNLSIAAWMVCEFLPHMTLAGVEHVAWIRATSLRGRSILETVLNWMPGQILTVFDDLEDAVNWLQQTRPELGSVSYATPRLPATQSRLAEEVYGLQQRIRARQPKAQPL